MVQVFFPRSCTASSSWLQNIGKKRRQLLHTSFSQGQDEIREETCLEGSFWWCPWAFLSFRQINSVTHSLIYELSNLGAICLMMISSFASKGHLQIDFAQDLNSSKPFWQPEDVYEVYFELGLSYSCYSEAENTSWNYFSQIVRGQNQMARTCPRNKPWKHLKSKRPQNVLCPLLETLKQDATDGTYISPMFPIPPFSYSFLSSEWQASKTYGNEVWAG